MQHATLFSRNESQLQVIVSAHHMLMLRYGLARLDMFFQIKNIKNFTWKASLHDSNQVLAGQQNPNIHHPSM